MQCSYGVGLPSFDRNTTSVQLPVFALSVGTTLMTERS